MYERDEKGRKKTFVRNPVRLSFAWGADVRDERLLAQELASQEWRDRKEAKRKRFAEFGHIPNAKKVLALAALCSRASLILALVADAERGEGGKEG